MIYWVLVLKLLQVFVCNLLWKTFRSFWGVFFFFWKGSLVLRVNWTRKWILILQNKINGILAVGWLTAQNWCINKGHFRCSSVIFLSCPFWIIFHVGNSPPWSSEKISRAQFHLCGPELFIGGKVKSFSENEGSDVASQPRFHVG